MSLQEQSPYLQPQQLLDVQEIYGFTGVPTQQKIGALDPLLINHGGIWLGALSVALVLNRKWASVLIFVEILTTGSRGAIVGSAFGVGVLLWAKSTSKIPTNVRFLLGGAAIASLFVEPTSTLDKSCRVHLPAHPLGRQRRTNYKALSSGLGSVASSMVFQWLGSPALYKGRTTHILKD